jgi:hypothetical protein
MADWCGKKMITTKIENTKIVPLRWIANWCGAIATRSLIKAVDLDENANWGFKYKYRAKVWRILNKPYRKWGTFYEVDFSDYKKDLEGSGWDDYNEFGKAYWDNDKGEQE